MLVLVFMLVMSTFCWLLVFSKSLRDMMPRRPQSRLLTYYENEQERREADNDLIKGIAIIPALIFSLLSLIGLLVIIARLLV